MTMPNVSVTNIFCELGSKNVRLKAILKGISDTHANIAILRQYLYRFRVCLNPSTSKKANMGNAILPIDRWAVYSAAFSVIGTMIAPTWSMTMVMIAIHLRSAALRRYRCGMRVVTWGAYALIRVEMHTPRTA